MGEAFALTKNIDEGDTPFIALAIELNTKLWTGDKKLSEGLAKIGVDVILSTAELRKLIK